METLEIKETSKTPAVYFDANQGIIELSGKLIPEDSRKFFTPLIEWIKQYSQSPNVQTIVNFKLEYFNTSSSKLIFELFKELDNMYKANNDTIINWYYEIDDYDMIDALETYKSMLKVPLNGIEITFPSN